MQGSEIIIVGGGMAGLACAVALEAAQHDWMLFEAAPQLGGRVATTEQDGFRLDAGFQVLLTAYPEAQAHFDYDALGLGHYDPAARLWLGNGRWATLGDPQRRLRYLLPTLTAPVSTWGDRWRVAQWQREVKNRPLEEIWQLPEQSARAALEARGFSAQMIQQFWQPYFGGIFLEKALHTSSRQLEFVFQMFNTGTATLPRDGMGALATQLSQRLPLNRVRTGTPIRAVRPAQLTLDDGTTLDCRRIILALDGKAAAQLLDDPTLEPPGWHATHCHYFALPAAEVPVRRPLLHLNSSGEGVIHNLSFPSLAQPSYAPRGQHLLSITTLTEASLPTLQAELATWFGEPARHWRHLRSLTIPQALPARASLDPVQLPLHREPGLSLIGDYRGLPSLNSTLAQGRQIAEEIIGGEGFRFGNY